ncbi:hypothetical protein K210_06755 [Erysipelothrix rhusiopathiae SY1027]|uniref:DUF951 domain-containing protein n=1 Tax=Erysipelothrix rhusiopathiae TaxID=1648 RepID=UPI0003348B5A|nr:DUF951 domain-containing protein [Erysipelothrix rhusiopathiae]AGN24939.1 hypothetical protein K210_06755 [Erysipelothrix rhusiopathiae SY1027]
MIDKTYGLGDIVQMKKDHPCKKSQYFKITRMGADIKIKCEGCGSVIMLTRQDFRKKLKKVIERNEEL